MRPQITRILVAASLVVAPHLAHAWSNFAFALVKQSVEDRAHQLFDGSREGSRAPRLPDASGGFSACREMFYGGREPAWPNQESLRPHKLCAEGYAVLYSGLTKTPLVVAERLNRASLGRAAGLERPDASRADGSRAEAFFADPRIPASDRASLGDYAGSGFDRGHMAPAADQSSPLAMSQSFALTNIVPQDPANNRKVWSKVESDVRKYVKRASGDVFVYTGPLFASRSRQVGASRVQVPSHLFKVVMDATTGKAWAYVLPNTAEAQITPPMSYADFERTTGLKLLH